MDEKEINWVDEFLARISTVKNDVLEIDIGGQKIAAVLSSDLIKFFNENKDLLLRLGKDHFKAFLMCVYEKKEEEAFLILMQKMSVDQMISSMKGEAESFKIYNDNMDEFVKKLKKFVVYTLFPLTAKVLLAALVA